MIQVVADSGGGGGGGGGVGGREVYWRSCWLVKHDTPCLLAIYTDQAQYQAYASPTLHNAGKQYWREQLMTHFITQSSTFNASLHNTFLAQFSTVSQVSEATHTRQYPVVSGNNYTTYKNFLK